MSVQESFGAQFMGDGVRFSLPAESAQECALQLFDPDGRRGERIDMHRSGVDAFEVTVSGLGAGARYRYIVDGSDVGDPYARFLPDGPDGSASVVSTTFDWQYPALGTTTEDLPIYELHVGTFTAEGTYRSAAKHLQELCDLGIGAIELMPLSTFAGARGWGYDGVASYAPFAPYGPPEDLAFFVDAAHAVNLRVILDVVYNHFGPVGNYLSHLAPGAFTKRHATPWGDAFDFSNPTLRRYVLDNARYWLDTFRFDGLRLDATHAIHDDTSPHVLRELASAAHACEPPRILIAEDERNQPSLLREDEVDSLWADDFHHQMHVALTSERDGYYSAYEGTAEDIARSIENNWFYDGGIYPPTGLPRGEPAVELAPARFVYCIQNHDQIGNRARGERLNHLVSIDAFAVASMILLVLPMTPLIFMGQEWGAKAPFLYFTDNPGPLGRQVTEGRRRELARFEQFAHEGGISDIPDPQKPDTWANSRLDWTERATGEHARILALYRALLHLRRTDVVLRDRSRERMHAWSHGSLLVVDRWSGSEKRRLLANLCPEPIPVDNLADAFRLLIATREVDERAPSVAPYTAALLTSSSAQ